MDARKVKIGMKVKRSTPEPRVFPSGELVDTVTSVYFTHERGTQVYLENQSDLWSARDLEEVGTPTAEYEADIIAEQERMRPEVLDPPANGNPDRAQIASLAEARENDEADIIKNPAHYARYKIQPIEFLMENEVKGHVFNIVKYAMRAGSKLYPNKTVTESEIIDYEKVIDYAQKRIRQLKGEPICLP